MSAMNAARKQPDLARSAVTGPAIELHVDAVSKGCIEQKLAWPCRESPVVNCDSVALRH
jgi:hypothetical protein